MRLQDQAETLADLLHADTGVFCYTFIKASGEKVLDA